MKILFALPVLIGALAAPLASAHESDVVHDAKEAAQAWLALTDGVQYAQSWEQASALFKGAVSKQDWEKALTATRTPLGALKSRTLKTVRFTTSLPGVPDGEYVVLQYQTQFANKAEAVETITPSHEADGSWKVSGYFIK